MWSAAAAAVVVWVCVWRERGMVADNSLSWVHRTKRGQMSDVKVLSELTCFFSHIRHFTRRC